MLRCPKCGSARVQRGFDDPSFLLRLLGVHELLCNNCGNEFRGFALPGTVKRSRGVKIELSRHLPSDQRRRALRTIARLPVQLIGSGTASAEDLIVRAPVPAVETGHTRDLSEIGLATVFPDAKFSDREFQGMRRRLHLSLQLPERPIRVFATAVRYEYREKGADDEGWLIGARITKMSQEDRMKLVDYLISGNNTNH